MTVYFHTLGCKVNQYETEAMRQMMADAGYETALYGDLPLAADGIVVINSCTVTKESDRKLRQFIHQLRRKAPGAVIVLTGCMPQAFPDAAQEITDADIVTGNACRRDLPRLIERFLQERRRIVDIPAHTAAYEPLAICTFQGRTRAFVKIEDGCNRFCTYCAIPYARGRVRSREIDDLRQEIRQLALAGYREVVLTGIDLTAFGQDTGATLADAVSAACTEPGICRVRLGSLEPHQMTPDLLDRLAAEPKLCPQFHLSLQSGCDDTLARMHRRYTAADYETLCGDLRRRFPGCAITTDIMVGFPGEDEREFAESLAFAEKIAFARAHIFTYSRRDGTPAAKAPSQVPRAEKEKRARRMSEVCERTRAAYESAMIGKTVQVLTETRRTDGMTEGHTDTYIPVRVRTDRAAGECVFVKILSRDADACIGEETYSL